MGGGAGGIGGRKEGCLDDEWEKREYRVGMSDSTGLEAGTPRPAWKPTTFTAI